MSRGEVYADEGVVRPSDCSIEHDITFEVNVAVSPTHGASTPVYYYTKTRPQFHFIMKLCEILNVGAAWHGRKCTSFKLP